MILLLLPLSRGMLQNDGLFYNTYSITNIFYKQVVYLSIVSLYKCTNHDLFITYAKNQGQKIGTVDSTVTDKFVLPRFWWNMKAQ